MRNCGAARRNQVSSTLSKRNSISTPLIIRTLARIALPFLPVERSRSRQRVITSRDTSPSAIKGMALPIPKANIVSATKPKLRPWAARTDAAPKVGPTQGLQTAPSSSPTPNCPRNPVVGAFPNLCSVQLLNGPAASASLSCKCGNVSTSPAETSNTAPNVLKNSPSRPIEYPIVATNDPITEKEIESPAASASGPSLCSDTAVPRTMGTKGRTQGDRIENNPANKASGMFAYSI